MKRKLTWNDEKKFYTARLIFLKDTITKWSQKQIFEKVLHAYESITGSANKLELHSRDWYLVEIKAAKDCLKAMYAATDDQNIKSTIANVLLKAGEGIWYNTKPD